MDDENDVIVASKFAELDRLEVPDTWPRASAQRGGQPSTGRRSLVLAAAVAVLALAAGATLVWALDSGGDTATSTVSTTPSTTVASTSAVRPFGDATIVPSVVEPGGRVTFTPARPVANVCGDVALVYAAGPGHDGIGQLLPNGGWTRFGPGVHVTVPACGQISAEPVTYLLPADLTDGTYILCDSQSFDSGACATFRVASSAATTRSRETAATTEHTTTSA